MYLIDTNVISEIRKHNRADAGVRAFFEKVSQQGSSLYISVMTLGELRRGVDLIAYRGDLEQAKLLELWLQQIVAEYESYILDITPVEAQIWGRLRVPHYENSIDKLIAATALSHDLTLVTRNIADFSDNGVKLINPFSE